MNLYIDKQKFYGPNGIFNGAIKKIDYKRFFSIESIMKCGEIIGLDVSMGFGVSLFKHLDNVRRTRYFENWMVSLGIQVIPNVR